jgi:hypothetical protein
MLFLNSTFLIFCLLFSTSYLNVSCQIFLFTLYRFYHECVRFTQFDFQWIYCNTLNFVIVSLLVYRGANLQFLWILKISRKTKLNQKSRDFCQMFVISKRKARTLGKKSIGFKNLWKIYSLTYGFSFFVISISGHVVINGYYTKTVA